MSPSRTRSRASTASPNAKSTAGAIAALERKRGLLIVFEGPDGSGKTTQRKLLKTWLKGEGQDVTTTKWNSSDLIKPLIKARKSARALSPVEFSLLHAQTSSFEIHSSWKKP